MELNNPKVIRAWCLYDWANSVYNLVITSTIFPIYYISVTTIGNSDLVSFFGFSVPNTVLYSYSLSFSFFIIAFMQPFLSGVADSIGGKKIFMKVFTYIGSFSCIALYFFSGSNIEFGITASVLASIGYGGALVFYNSFLPEISSFDRYDRVSARGFSYGYIGSVILLVFNLIMIQKPEWFGMVEGSLPARISFLTVGIWWIGFAQVTFYYLPGNIYKRSAKSNYLVSGFNEILKVLKSLKGLPELKKFLISFFFYSIGVQTIMYMAPTFGDKELQLSPDKLIITVLIIQLVAIFGSYLFARISEKRGNRFSLITMIIIWIFVCIGAFYTYTDYEFFALAFSAGLVMGGIQSLSRATYSKLIPSNTIDHASYFSFYDVTFNLSIVLGTFSYGLIEHWTGSMRYSALTLGGFFIIGLFFILNVSIPKNYEEAIKI